MQNRAHGLKYKRKSEVTQVQTSKCISTTKRQKKKKTITKVYGI